MRKVQGLDSHLRIDINNPKFAQIMKYIIWWDLEYSYQYYTGLVIDGNAYSS